MVSFQVRELHPALGAEIEDLDLSQNIDRETVAALRDVFHRRGLLLLQGRDVDPDEQAYLVGLVVGENAPADRAEAIGRTHTYSNYVTNQDADGYAPFGELLFHCDMMWGENPMQVLSLYGHRVTPPTVPTRFASMVLGLETLPAGLRARVEGRNAVHQTGQQRRGEHKDQLVEPQHEVVRSTVKPVLWTHPRTGDPVLFVSQQMTARIEDMEPDDSEALLEELFAHLYRPEVVVDHEWRQGDLVVWDNLAVQHARGNVEFEGPERTLRKVIAPVPTDTRIAKPVMVQAGSVEAGSA
jgi:alpha-ketoglutarate-dependent taurine dioxygenase